MSFYDDYVAEGLCCQSCGAFLGGDEPGHPRFCGACEPGQQRAQEQRALARAKAKPKPKRKAKRNGRA